MIWSYTVHILHEAKLSIDDLELHYTPTGRKVIVTDSWVIKTSTYFVYVAHQNDIHLSLAKSEEHDLSYQNMTSIQFVHIDVKSVNPHIAAFTLR